MNYIESLSKDHVITKIYGCNSSGGYQRGVKITYGVWENDSVTNEIELSDAGNT